MGAGSSSRKRASVAVPEPEPEPEPEQEPAVLPPLRGTAELSPAALAVATSTSWEDGSSPASFSSSAMSAGPRQPFKAIGQYTRRREPKGALEISRRDPGVRFARGAASTGVDGHSVVVTAAVTIQSAFRAHRVRNQVDGYRRVAEGYSTKLATRRIGERRARRGADRAMPASKGGNRTTLQTLPTNADRGAALAVELPEDAMRSARVREWVATGGEISPGGGITMTNRTAVTDAFLSGSQAKPAKLSTVPTETAAAGSMGEKYLGQRGGSVERVEGSQAGSIDNHEVGDSVSSYDAGVNSPFRRRVSRAGPPSATTHSSWEDSASAHIPSPSEVRKRARARKGPRRRRHPPKQRGSASVVSRSDMSASSSQPPWQGMPASWPGGPPGWGYPPPPSVPYGPPPATAPAGVAAHHTPAGWADAFHQGPPPQMASGFPPRGIVWSHHHQQHHSHPPQMEQSHYGQHPGGPPVWWGARFRAEVPAAHAAAHDAQVHAQQTATAVPGDMLGRIDRIEGAMEALLQRLTDQPMPLQVKQPPRAEDQTGGTADNSQQN